MFSIILWLAPVGWLTLSQYCKMLWPLCKVTKWYKAKSYIRLFKVIRLQLSTPLFKILGTYVRYSCGFLMILKRMFLNPWNCPHFFQQSWPVCLRWGKTACSMGGFVINACTHKTRQALDNKSVTMLERVRSKRACARKLSARILSPSCVPKRDSDFSPKRFALRPTCYERVPQYVVTFQGVFSLPFFFDFLRTF